MSVSQAKGFRKEVENIIRNTEQDPRLRVGGAGATRDQLPQLTDQATIAMESLRSQWRTIANLGTHERMTISQLRVYGPMPMSELASRIALSRAAVTSLIDRLEATGWVQRRADERDRRRTVLSLLPRSVEEFDAVSEAYRSELVEWASSMSDEEWRSVASFLGRLAEIAERQATELRSTAVERSLR